MGRILALDVGDARIGVAISDNCQIIASPLETIEVGKVSIVDHLQKIIEEYDIKKVVYGMPTNLKGVKHRQANKVKEFIEKLSIAIENVEFVEYDERYTSVMAREVLMDSKNKKTREFKGKIDKIAAAILLQDYLKSNKEQ